MERRHGAHRVRLGPHVRPDDYSGVRPARSPVGEWPAGPHPGEFVCLRREQQRLPAGLISPTADGAVLHGIGGASKATLTTELIRRIFDHNPVRVPAVLSSEAGRGVTSKPGGPRAQPRRSTTRLLTCGDIKQAQAVTEHIFWSFQPETIAQNFLNRDSTTAKVVLSHRSSSSSSVMPVAAAFVDRVRVMCNTIRRSTSGSSK